MSTTDTLTPKYANPIGRTNHVASRVKDDADSFDFFPTPPWVARCIIGEILPNLKISVQPGAKIWEPACGAGHMAGPLAEMGMEVFASDIAYYGWAPSMIGSFIGPNAIAAPAQGIDWVITNPPFKASKAFVERALDIAKFGVVMFTRLQWLETAGRWALRQQAPLWAGVTFADRVGLFKGECHPGRSTAIAYAVMIWHRTDPNGPWQMPGQFEATWCVPPAAVSRWTHPTDLTTWAGKFSEKEPRT